eukprot:Hpha_TRINITY_DN15316_c6_g17::TRINITY_DN15316_c6_g17_i1::g.90025::m.90025
MATGLSPSPLQYSAIRASPDSGLPGRLGPIGRQSWQGGGASQLASGTSFGMGGFGASGTSGPSRKVPPRVLPLLCDDLKTRPATHQHMNLLTFREHWSDVQRVNVTPADTRELLMVLFILANDPSGRQGIGEADTRRKQAVSRLSFETLHMVFGDPHPHFKTFTLGLQQLMKELHCDDEHFYARPEPTVPPDNYEKMRNELEKEWERERQRRRAGLVKEEQSQQPKDSEALVNARSMLAEAHELQTLCSTEGVDVSAETLQRRLAELEGRVLQATATGRSDAETAAELSARTAKPAAMRAADLVLDATELVRRTSEEETQAAGKAETPAEEPPPATAAADEEEEDRPPPAFTATLPSQAEPPPVIPLEGTAEGAFPQAMTAEHLKLDMWLQQPETRPFAVQLMRCWDYSGINVHFFVEGMNRVHLYLPYLYSSRTKVYRDFICCTQRPPVRTEWATPAHVHIKTNIPARSDIMYRFLVEGYNYGNNAIIHSDIAGYTHRQWRRLGRGAMEEAGWPEGWDDDMSNSYTNGCAIDQYYSSDGFVVIVLEARSFFCVGFSVSAWLVVHGFGAGFELTASIHHQDARL